MIPLVFLSKYQISSKEDLVNPIVIGGEKLFDYWNFSISPDTIKEGTNLNKLWAKEKIDEIMFQNSIGSLDAGIYKNKVIDLSIRA